SNRRAAGLHALLFPFRLRRLQFGLVALRFLFFSLFFLTVLLTLVLLPLLLDPLLLLPLFLFAILLDDDPQALPAKNLRELSYLILLAHLVQNRPLIPPAAVQLEILADDKRAHLLIDELPPLFISNKPFKPESLHAGADIGNGVAADLED